MLHYFFNFDPYCQESISFESVVSIAMHYTAFTYTGLPKEENFDCINWSFGSYFRTD